MTLVQIPVTEFETVIKKLAQFPLCYQRYQSLSINWQDCTIEEGWFAPEQPGLETEIPEIYYGDDFHPHTVSMTYEVNKLGDSDDINDHLYELMTALAKHNPIASGRSTPSLGSYNDYQRGRD